MWCEGSEVLDPVPGGAFISAGRRGRLGEERAGALYEVADLPGSQLVEKVYGQFRQ